MAKAYEEENADAPIYFADRRDGRLFVFTTEPNAWQSRLAQRLVDLEAKNAKLRRQLDYEIESHNGTCDQRDKLRAALGATQWGFYHVRCPVCAGFDGRTERDHVHNKECIVGKALAEQEK